MHINFSDTPGDFKPIDTNLNLGSTPPGSGTLGSLRKFPNNDEVIEIQPDDSRSCAKQVVLFNALSWERKELVSVRVTTPEVGCFITILVY